MILGFWAKIGPSGKKEAIFGQNRVYTKVDFSLYSNTLLIKLVIYCFFILQSKNSRTINFLILVKNWPSLDEIDMRAIWCPGWVQTTLKTSNGYNKVMLADGFPNTSLVLMEHGYNNNNIFRHFKNITISALRVPSFNVTWIIWPSGSLADPLSNCPFTKWAHSQLQAGRGIEKVSQSAYFAISYEWAHISFCFQHSNHPKSFGWFVLLIK